MSDMSGYIISNNSKVRTKDLDYPKLFILASY